MALPSDLLWAVKAEQKASGLNRSQVIAGCIKASLAPDPEPAPGGVDCATREELEALDERVKKIERLAESSGAL